MAKKRKLTEEQRRANEKASRDRNHKTNHPGIRHDALVKEGERSGFYEVTPGTNRAVFNLGGGARWKRARLIY